MFLPKFVSNGSMQIGKFLHLKMESLDPWMFLRLCEKKHFVQKTRKVKQVIDV